MKQSKHNVANQETLVAFREGADIASIITKRSAERLRLATNKDMYDMVKATNVMIAACWGAQGC